MRSVVSSCMSLLLAALLTCSSVSAFTTRTTTPLLLVRSSAVRVQPVPKAPTVRSTPTHLAASSANSGVDSLYSPGAGSGTATIPQEIFNLVKAIVGAGVLTLPAGIAAFGNAPSAAIPAVVLIAVIGALSAYGFGLIGRVCSLTNTSSFRDAWSASVSTETSWIPAWSVTCKTMFATLAYSMILGDTFTSIFTTAGLNLSKTATLSGITAAVLLPLCLLKNLSSLAPFSLLGTLGMVYTAIAMAIRYFGKAYLKGGAFATDLPLEFRPKFGTVGASGIWNPATGILIGMLSTAYMAHFNAPKFYTELKDNTVPRYLKVVSTSFIISIAIFAAMASLGFLTFGAHSCGLILNNYSTRDGLMGISRIAVAISLVFSYPLAFVGARDGILDLVKVDAKKRTGKLLNSLTVGMLTFLTTAALLIPDVSFVLAFAGATLGNALIYIFPALMFRGAIQKKENPTRLQKAEVKVALTSAVLGTVMGVMGAVKAVQSIL